MDEWHSVTGRRWRMADDASADNAADATAGISDRLGRLCALRLASGQSAEDFLSPNLTKELSSMVELKDSMRAAERLKLALERGEKMGIISDYDVDGSSAAALFCRVWRDVGGKDIPVIIPDRLVQGYGPNTKGLKDLLDGQVRLLLMLDCGSTAVDIIDQAIACGCEVIVMDHHKVDKRLLSQDNYQGLILVNPKREDQDSAAQIDICATAVVFIVLVAFRRVLGRKDLVLQQYLDLVALATVCDMMPMDSFNRALARSGLRVIRRGGNNLGLTVMLDRLRLRDRATCRDMAFMVGPRLNAGSRMGRSRLAFDLLSSRNLQSAADNCKALDILNEDRKDATTSAFGEVRALEFDDDKIILVARDDIHLGVIGLVAQQLASSFHLPAFVLSRDGDIYRGSARSSGDYDVGAFLLALSNEGLLINGGGHKAAGGLTVARDKLDQLRKRVLEEKIDKASPAPLVLDAALKLDEIDLALLDEIDLLAPFGPSNAEPLFLLDKVIVSDSRVLGGKHVRLTLSRATDKVLTAMAFNVVERSPELYLALREARGKLLTLAVRVARETYRGQEKAVLYVVDSCAPE